MPKSSSLFQSYRACCNALGESASALIKQNQAYLATSFPSAFQGLFSDDSANKQEIAQAYYKHAAAVCRLLGQMENDVLVVSRIMQQADQGMNEEIVALCDVFLSQYTRFRQSINTYLTQCESLIRKCAERVPRSELLRYLRSLQAHTELWLAFLKQESQDLPKKD